MLLTEFCCIFNQSRRKYDWNEMKTKQKKTHHTFNLLKLNFDVWFCSLFLTWSVCIWWVCMSSVVSFGRLDSDRQRGQEGEGGGGRDSLRRVGGDVCPVQWFCLLHRLSNGNLIYSCLRILTWKLCSIAVSVTWSYPRFMALSPLDLYTATSAASHRGE